MRLYANSCWSDGGPIISVKIKQFHAGSASLCYVSWFWVVQNTNNSWSLFQCSLMGEGCWIQATAHWLARSAREADVTTCSHTLSGSWPRSCRCCVTYASNAESLCKTHPPLGSSVCWEPLGKDLHLAKERAERVTGFSVQFEQQSLKRYDWRDKLAVARDLFILLDE